jgi:hypothetical protein
MSVCLSIRPTRASIGGGAKSSSVGGSAAGCSFIALDAVFLASTGFGGAYVTGNFAGVFTACFGGGAAAASSGGGAAAREPGFGVVYSYIIVFYFERSASLGGEGAFDSTLAPCRGATLPWFESPNWTGGIRVPCCSAGLLLVACVIAVLGVSLGTSTCAPDNGGILCDLDELWDSLLAYAVCYLAGSTLIGLASSVLCVWTGSAGGGGAPAPFCSSCPSLIGSAFGAVISPCEWSPSSEGGGGAFPWAAVYLGGAGACLAGSAVASFFRAAASGAFVGAAIAAFSF